MSRDIHIPERSPEPIRGRDALSLDRSREAGTDTAQSRPPVGDTGHTSGRDAGPNRDPDKVPSAQDRGQQESPDRHASRERLPVLSRGRSCRVSEAELETLYEIGRFRTLAVQDLVNHKYKGNSTELQQDLRALVAQGLVQRRTAWLHGGKGQLSVVVLTRAGKDLLEHNRDAFQQALYAGFVKPGEVAHDAAIYRMYHAEASEIEKKGGKIQRIVLDYELKRSVYSPLAKAKSLPPMEYAKRQAQVAHENGLKVVAGKIPLPDLRIEYETAEGDLTRVDLELATHHYHGSHLRTKAEAGFKMYSADDFARGSAVRDEREITAEILSL